LDTHKQDNTNNNEGLNMDDFEEPEDYEPTDPDGFDQQTIDILGSNHDDLLGATVIAVGTIMYCWSTHMYHW
jgi:hypothetical protein